MPGSHNGLNHSGKRGFVAWMGSVMGLANAQRRYAIDFVACARLYLRNQQLELYPRSNAVHLAAGVRQSRPNPRSRK